MNSLFSVNSLKELVRLNSKKAKVTGLVFLFFSLVPSFDTICEKLCSVEKKQSSKIKTLIFISQSYKKMRRLKAMYLVFDFDY